MGFIQDQDLTHISAKQLLGFKEKTFTILQRHQAHLIDISQNFECLSSDDEFPAQLTKLRLQAMKERIALDGEMRDLWLSSGMARSVSSSLPAQGFQSSALGLINKNSLTSDLGPGDPELKINIEIDGVSGEERPYSRKLASGMFYLFEAQKFLSGDTDGKKSERKEPIYLEIAPGRPADADPVPLPAAEIRRLILSILPGDADLLAFCMDYFPKVCQRFGDNMDSLTKINWLLRLES